MTRAVWLTVAIAAFVALSKLIIENVLGWSLEPAAVSWLVEPRPASAVAVVGLLASDVFLPVPSSVVMVLSGVIFGVLWGSLLALIGSIAGEWLGFELVRRYGRRASARLIGDAELARLQQLFDRHGALAVAITRPLPIVMETMSLVAGLSGMRRSSFLAASLAGTAPIVAIYAYAGAYSKDVGSFIPAIVILVVVAAGGWLVYRAQAGTGTGERRQNSEL